MWLQIRRGASAGAAVYSKWSHKTRLLLGIEGTRESVAYTFAVQDLYDGSQDTAPHKSVHSKLKSVYEFGIPRTQKYSRHKSIKKYEA